ncbi:MULTISPECIES: ABC-F family ATP-binding cassette domain-containing protein [unclassified Beijerinckia]|uniref:ABC-F family ATP-binding cassette domain-containing protein n=1 Tax=unclassified Beijerinckia TaxID=2638183 RepID=UPI00089A2A55|nr:MULTISPECIES: ABC-F family ATP-binding cassette domain-containing protein [unclassified Beijerinckia]MDH7799322.1 ATPase subunit of ABC transporter with duplicated ATPase domains [Beijerinckia sp. GAS462]SED46196.1 ATPase components of ABC transporters with duplicated ATPase domains [Beijerinckia sp. 28-YEA-48]
MSASITLSALSWSASDGRSLLSSLDLSFGADRTGLVGRNGVGKTTLLKLIAGELQPQSGSLAVNGTVRVLRQSVQFSSEETVADLFGVSAALLLLRRAESGEAGVAEIAEADWTLESRVASALARFDLDTGADAPLVNLSGGQRTRAGLAALVFAEPDFLLLDEPTNNLDRDGREAVIDLLANWRSGAIVVSHDRELLEAMDSIVELTSLGATRYGGNWSAYRRLKALDLAAAQHDLADAERQMVDLARKTQVINERKARKDGVGRKASAKDDMPRILLGRRKERSETTSGDNARLAKRRSVQAHEAVVDARARLEVLQPLTVTLAPTHLPRGKIVLKMDAVAFGYEPDRPLIHDLSFTISGPERLAIVGPNGSGKTTVLGLISGALRPWSGTVEISTDFVLLDQQVSVLDPSLSIRDNFRRINPQAGENDCRAALARFMFRADAALQKASTLSGGQLLRAGLACVLGGSTPPSLLILDEPTNHLDIDAIEAVEAGLRAYDGALLVVSHDETFLDAIGISRRLDLSDRLDD